MRSHNNRQANFPKHLTSSLCPSRSVMYNLSPTPEQSRTKQGTTSPGSSSAGCYRAVVNPSCAANIRRACLSCLTPLLWCSLELHAFSFQPTRAALPVGAVPRSPVPLSPGSQSVGHAKLLYQASKTHQEAARICSQHHRLSPLVPRLSSLASRLLLSCPASFTQQRPSTVPGFPLGQQCFTHQPNRLCGSCLKCLDSDPQPRPPPSKSTPLPHVHRAPLRTSGITRAYRAAPDPHLASPFSPAHLCITITPRYV